MATTPEDLKRHIANLEYRMKEDKRRGIIRPEDENRLERLNKELDSLSKWAAEMFQEGEE